MNSAKLVHKFRFTIAGLIFLAGGCTVGPNYQNPDLPVPAAWTEAQQKGVAARAVELARWWTKFNDPLLDSLVDRAAKSNLDLRLAEARIREARASRAVTASGAWPTVDVSGSYTRNRASENAIGAPAQGAVVAPSGSANLDQNLYRTGFDANWEIDVFGGVRRSVEAADATIEVTVEDRRDVLVTLLGEVARNYIDLQGVSAPAGGGAGQSQDAAGHLGTDAGPFSSGIGQRLGCGAAGGPGQHNGFANSDIGKWFEAGGLRARCSSWITARRALGRAGQRDGDSQPAAGSAGRVALRSAPTASGCSSRRTTTGRRDGAGGRCDRRLVPEVFSDRRCRPAECQRQRLD